MMNKVNCSILINSCDSYEDVWNPFFSCFKENWKNCPYPLFLNTESKKYEKEGMNITSLTLRKNMKIEWGERLLDCLERIETEYVILLFDDFCLEDNVNQVEIENCLSEMEKNKNIDVFYIDHLFPELIDGTDNKFVEVPIGKEYRLNSCPGIWRKTSLINYTGKIDNAWAWEYFGSFRTEKIKTSKFYALNALPDMFPYNYKLGGAIHRGKWVKSVIDPINTKYNLNIDFSQRGFADELIDENPTLWLIKFTLTGYRMIGPRALLYFKHIHIMRALVKRILRIFGITVRRHPLRIIYKKN